MAEAPATHLLGPRHWPAWVALGLLRALSWLPLPVLAVLGGALGQLAYYVAASPRRIAHVNLTLCFPALTPRARGRLARRHFRALGQSLLSIGLAWWGSTARLQRLVRLRNRHYLDDAMAAGKPVILLAPHFLAMEIGGIRLSTERKYSTMYKRSKNAVLESFFRKRQRYAALVVERSGNLKGLIRALRAGIPFYYLPDQDPGDSAAVFAPFFGVPTATVTALARMAKLAKATVIPCFTRILPRGQGYEVVFYPPLADFPSDDAVADAARMNAAIEKGARETPEQYMWTYKRFKRQPDNACSPYA